MVNSIFNFKNQLAKHENWKNHLYDEIETNDEEYPIGEFTEDDLKDNNNVEVLEDEYKVKSQPLKMSVIKQQDDPYNPYTNPNLDSDLSMTIGKIAKKKGKHK